MSDTPTPPAPGKCINSIRILYLFAGVRRKNDIKEHLEKLCAKHNLDLHLQECDLLQNGAQDDILDDNVWAKITKPIADGMWDYIIGTPPCNNFSRSLYANSRGPRPTRSRQHPRGFPWNKGAAKIKTQAANKLVDRTFEAFKLGSQSSARTRWLAEHPEDLGDTSNNCSPASIWQWSEVQRFIADEDAVEGALYQCRYPEALSSKPTRLASTVKGIRKMLFVGRPRFNKSMRYVGPLPGKCCNKKHKRVLGWNNAKQAFNTAPAASYPPEMCEDIATAIVEDHLEKGPPCSQSACGKEVTEALEAAGPPTSARPSPPPSPPLSPAPPAPKRGRTGKQTKERDEDFWDKVLATRTMRKENLQDEPHWHELLRDHPTSDEDEDHVSRPPLGSWPIWVRLDCAPQPETLARPDLCLGCGHAQRGLPRATGHDQVDPHHVASGTVNSLSLIHI